MSGAIPLDLRREEIAIRDIGKIYSYSTKIPIKNQLDKWRRKETTLLRSKGITPDITYIASRLAVYGKPRIIDNPFICTVFNLSRLSLFPICHTQLAYCKTTKIPIKNQLDKWRRKETTDRHISPLGLMCLQGEETKIDVKNIEKEFQFILLYY
jgi:hypothetical protein